MKSIVVYSSLCGNTKQYAEWISEEVGADCVCVDYASSEQLSQYDVVIFGSHVRFGDITHRKRFAELSKNLKKVIVFVVGGAPAEPNPVLPSIFKKIHKSIPQSASVPQFYFQGGLKREALPEDERAYLDKQLKIMKILSIILIPARETLRHAVYMMSHDSDNTSKEAIAPLVDYLNK